MPRRSWRPGLGAGEAVGGGTGAEGERGAGILRQAQGEQDEEGEGDEAGKAEALTPGPSPRGRFPHPRPFCLLRPPLAALMGEGIASCLSYGPGLDGPVTKSLQRIGARVGVTGQEGKRSGGEDGIPKGDGDGPWDRGPLVRPGRWAPAHQARATCIRPGRARPAGPTGGSRRDSCSRRRGAGPARCRCSQTRRPRVGERSRSGR